VLNILNPKEEFIGKKPYFVHFRIFDFLVYCHLPSDKRKNFYSTADKGIFVSYNKNLKAYRVYVPALKKTVVRRDVRLE
jgi:hypothetical protein